MSRNVGTIDRWLRVAAGIVLLTLGFGGFVGGTLGLVFKVLGFVPIATGLLGWCPLYALFGVSSCPVADAKAPKRPASV